MTDVIKNDMYGKIKNVKDIASRALGQVDLGSKVLKTSQPAKIDIDVESKTSKNATLESASGAPEIKSSLLSKICPKKVNAKTEEPVDESAEKKVTKIPAEVTKAQKAKALVKAKKADAKETKIK